MANIVVGRPPNFQAILAVFPLAYRPGVIFAYAPHIYNPSGDPISAELQAHEQVHIDRQGDDPESWWNQYLTSPMFRCNEELLAHRAEYRAHKPHELSRPARRFLLTAIAKRLASPLYGNMLSVEDAKYLIKNTDACIFLEEYAKIS